MASARVFFSKRRQQRNGFINDEIPVVENGYDAQDSEEDEVFVQDPNLEISASKPLMHPRNKGQRTKIQTRTFECRICALCKPILYFAALVTVLCSVMATIVYIANRHRGQSNKALLQEGVTSGVQQQVKEKTILIGCDTLEVEDVWVVGFPKILTESAFRILDVDGDGVDDVILGFATGADGFGASDIVCDLYFKGQRPCLGGVLALDGKTGQELWRHYTEHEVYSLNCQYDVDKDGTEDCLAGGRAGVLVCISGKDGALIWTLGKDSEARRSVMNFYTPQYVGDLDGDDVADIVITHGGDPLMAPGSKNRLSGRILVISGKTGSVLRWIKVPDGRESYYSPQIITHLEDIQLVLFGTGGETHNGSLWRLELNSLLNGLADRALKISSDTHKGFMTPPALVDLTGDGVEDILVPSFNSTLLAVDGKSYQPLWSVRFESSESYSTPAIGFYNDDEIPDALVKFAHGPGFPVYYFSQTTVIDGKTGAKLIDPPLRDSIGSQSSGLTVSMEGPGNDVFLVWMADCKGHEGAREKFSFKKGTSQKEKTHSDFCHLRFKSRGVSRLIALSRHLPADGALVYTSETRKAVEHSKWVNTSAEAYDYVIQHPQILDKYRGNSWPSNDDELRSTEAEQLYDNQNYAGMHRTGSKKGPSIGLADTRRKNVMHSREKINDGDRRRLNYLSTQYLEQQKNPYQSDILTQTSGLSPPNSRDDQYGFPYKDKDATSYYEKQYGPFYSSGRGREEDDDPYSEGFPYGYRSRPYQQRRRTRNDRSKRSVIYSRTRRKPSKVYERHVHAHDNDGFQRLISTGVLAPTLLPAGHMDYNRTIDVIFATYWSYPAQTTAVLEDDQKCISEMLGKEMIDRFDEDSPYYQMNHDDYEKAVTEKCLSASDHRMSEDGVYRASDDDYNPFKLNMGQMTVYRLRLKFTCTQELNSTESDSQCATVLPFSRQKWSAYMGTNGDSHWTNPLYKQ